MAADLDGTAIGSSTITIVDDETTTTACLAPNLTGRTQIWTGTVTVEALQVSGITVAHGFSVSDNIGALDDTTFALGQTTM